jgi:hypothetical protein
MVDASYIEGLKTGLWLGFVAGFGAGLAWVGLRLWWQRRQEKLAKERSQENASGDKPGFRW